MYNKTKILSVFIAALWAAMVVGTLLSTINIGIVISAITLILFVGTTVFQKRWHVHTACGLVALLTVVTVNNGVNAGAGIVAATIVLILWVDLRKRSEA